MRLRKFVCALTLALFGFQTLQLTAVADEGKATAGEPAQHLDEHRPRQVGATGLALARQVQPRQQRQRQDRHARAGQADGHGQHDPVMTTGGGHPFLTDCPAFLPVRIIAITRSYIKYLNKEICNECAFTKALCDGFDGRAMGSSGTPGAGL